MNYKPLKGLPTSLSLGLWGLWGSGILQDLGLESLGLFLQPQQPRNQDLKKNFEKAKEANEDGAAMTAPPMISLADVQDEIKRSKDCASYGFWSGLESQFSPCDVVSLVELLNLDRSHGRIHAELQRSGFSTCGIEQQASGILTILATESAPLKNSASTVRRQRRSPPRTARANERSSSAA